MPARGGPEAGAAGPVTVVGLGGIGAPVAGALAQFLAFEQPGATLWLVDGDVYEERNRRRVLFGAPENKALGTARELTRALGGSVTIVPVPEYLTARNAARLIADGDTVFLCVDNHASRRLVSRRCQRLADVVLVSGGNDAVEDGRDGTAGNVQLYVRRDGEDVTNPLTRFHPEIARPRDRPPDRAGCAELGSAAPQLLFTNLAVAAAMLGTYHAWRAGTLDYEELYLDIARGRVTPVRRAVRRSAAR